VRVFVTGATGLLGSNLVERLCQDGHQVVALARNPQKAKGLRPDIETVMGDLADVAGFAGRLKSCQAVVHCAAYFREYYGSGEHAVNLERLAYST
jgi:dihydroflavonol-4-reductase